MDGSAIDELTAQERTDAVGQLHALMGAVHGQLLAFVAAVDRQGDWEADGATSTAAWLSALLSVEVRTAREWVDAARALEGLPAVAAAYHAGRLSWDQLRPVLRMATPDTDAHSASDAPGRSPAELTAMAQRSRSIDAAEAAEAHRRRTVRFRPGEHGMTRMSANMPTERAGALATVLSRMALDAPPDPTTGLFEPWTARLADALGDLAEASLATDIDTDRATIVVHAAAETLTGDAAGAADVEGGGSISLDTVRRLACGGAHLQVVGEDEQGRPVIVGRKQRLFSAWQRRQIRRRHPGCSFPGCDRHAFLRYHHLQPYGADGLTDTWNGIALCTFHHRLLHEGGWTTTGDPDLGTLRFVRPDGRPYRPGPASLRADLRQRIFGPTATSPSPAPA